MVNAALVDSNVFIDLLRQGCDPTWELRAWAHDMDLVTCGMIRLEVLRGIKQPTVRERVSAFMDVMCCVPTDNRLWSEAADLAWRLDRRSIVLPAQDILIAACALRFGAAVLTADAHFRKIPDLVVLSLS